MKSMAQKFRLVLCLAGIIFSISFQQIIEAHGPVGWATPAKEKKVKNPVPSTTGSRSRGQAIYLEKCASCHGVRGDGKSELGKGLKPPPPNFTDLHMMKEMTDGEIFWKINTGKGPMPSYGKELKEKEKWDLVNYLKSLAEPK